MDVAKTIIEENLVVFFTAIFILLAILAAWNSFLHFKLEKIQSFSREFFKGENAKNLESVILDQAKNLKVLDKDIQELYGISNKINALASRSVHKVSVVRFNPFKDVGGNQSFSLALLNGKNDGLTITALYTKEGTRVYSKSIVNGESANFPLTDEEKEAIKIAILQDNKIKAKKIISKDHD